MNIGKNPTLSRKREYNAANETIIAHKSTGIKSSFACSSRYAQIAQLSLWSQLCVPKVIAEKTSAKTYNPVL